MKSRVVQDVGELEAHAFGPRMTTWWGTIGMMAIEGTSLALAAGVYLYLAARNPQWPPSAPLPSLFWSSIMTVLMVVSIVPNLILMRVAKAEDRPKVRLWLIVLALFGLATLVIRGFEFTGLNVRWDANAYGSIVWHILVVHTTYIAADWVDTIVLTVLMFTPHGVGKRFSDAEEDAIFWWFVIATWIAIYLLIYWFPRIWGSG
jgi:heme/copper-type cytochrome/quinol oxidase subunit 3